MKPLHTLFRHGKEKLKLLSKKQYTTIAGTLVFFLIMSLVPFIVWITLLLGRNTESIDKLLSMPLFFSVKDVIEFIRKEAENATNGASVFLVITTLYSSSGFFFHLRRSGEVLYACDRPKSGFKTHLIALAFTLGIELSGVVLIGAFAFFGNFISKIFSGTLEILFDSLFLLATLYPFLLVINVYVCPYKQKKKDVFKNFNVGTVVTLLAWTVSAVGFGIYLKFSNSARLYGALTTVFVFFLWLYVMMVCLTAGIVLNTEKVRPSEKQGT